MNKLVVNAGIILAGILLCSTAYALGPPGTARNGGTGSGIDNSYEQLAAAKAAEQKSTSTRAATQSKQPKRNDYPMYVNITKVSNRFTPVSP